MPHSKLKRFNFGFNSTYHLTEKLTADASANYVNSESVGRNETGYDHNIMTSFRQWFETNVNIQELKEMYEMTHANYSWNPASSSDPVVPIFWDNPYFFALE
jgi:hypothetical protein